MVSTAQHIGMPQSRYAKEIWDSAVLIIAAVVQEAREVTSGWIGFEEPGLRKVFLPMVEDWNWMSLKVPSLNPNHSASPGLFHFSL